MADMTQEQMLEQQKANCPFCKIVKGEIPAKKVYEDDIMLAILDINPANKGHVLVLPKEHYPILPLIPPPTFKHMFVTTKKLMSAMRKGLIVPKVTMFLANGGAAGQMSPHFLYHLIPREEGDGLDKLDVPKRETAQNEIEQSMAQNVQAIMRNHLVREMQAGSPVAQMATQSGDAAAAPAQGKTLPASTGMGASAKKEEISQHLMLMLQQNPQLKELIKKNPEMVEEYVKKSPELSVLFEGVNISALSAKLRQQDAQSDAPPSSPEQKPAVPAQDELTPVEVVEPETVEVDVTDGEAEEAEFEEAVQEAEALVPEQTDSAVDDIPDAATMTDTELLAYLDQKPRLKEMLIEDLEGLETLAKTNPRVKKFFEHTTPRVLAERLLAIVSKQEAENAKAVVEEKESEEHDELEGADFLALSEYWRGKDKDLRG